MSSERRGLRRASGRARRASILAGAVALALVGAGGASAQVPRPWEGPRWWMGAWFGGLFPGSVDDPDTGIWSFGDNVAGGAEMGLRVGEGAFLIGDVSYTRTAYDRFAGLGGASGRADILTTVAGVRYALFSGPRILYSPFGVLGLGAVHYRLSDLGEFDTDFAVVTGGGLDWRLGTQMNLVVAGYDFLVFHPRADTRSRANTSHIVELRLGLRWGL